VSEQFQNSTEKSQKGFKIDTPNNQIHDRSHSCLGTDSSVNKAVNNKKK